MDKTTTFFNCSFSLSKIVRCPCSRCQNTRCLEDKTIIIIHLCKNGFVSGYVLHPEISISECVPFSIRNSKFIKEFKLKCFDLILFYIQNEFLNISLFNMFF
jgi:hypothetical protein